MGKRIIFSLIGIVVLVALFFSVQHFLKNVEQDKIEYIAVKTEKNNKGPIPLKQIDEFIDYDFIDDSQHPSTMYHYLALGDSLTQGVGDEQNKGGFSDRLAQKIEDVLITNVDIENRGKRGRRSDQLLNLVEKGQYDIEIGQADLITITIGGNDMMKIVKNNLFHLEKKLFDKGRKSYQERLSKIVSHIREENETVPIILVGVYNPFPYISNDVKELETVVDEWNDSIKQVADDDTNACFVNVADLFSEKSNIVYHTDFFHPNSYGYRLMSERIFENLIQCNILKLNQNL